MHFYKSHVAVITRTQNRPLMLRRALATLSEQTFSDYRVWVINDGGDKECVEQTEVRQVSEFGAMHPPPP